MAKYVLRITIAMFDWNFSSLGLETVFSFPVPDKNEKQLPTIFFLKDDKIILYAQGRKVPLVTGGKFGR